MLSHESEEYSKIIDSIDPEIIKFWKQQISEQDEVDVYPVDDVLYFAFGLQSQYRNPSLVYKNTLLGKWAYGKIQVFYQDRYYDCEEFLKLLKLKAFW